MPQESYFGEYAKFYVQSENGGADFMGADNLVGDKYTIEIRDTGEKYTANLVNRFGKEVGYLDERVVRRLQLAQAKGWVVGAFLSFVAFTEGKDDEHPGYYWGEMALLAYDPKLASVMEAFEETLSKKMADGARPQVDFGQKSVELLMAGPGAWFPTDSAPRPKIGKGSSLLKDHRTPNERLIEQSRKGNIGCYIASWAFIILMVALVVFALHSCGLF